MAGANDKANVINKWATIAARPTPNSNHIDFIEGIIGSNRLIFVPFAEIITGNNKITAANAVYA